MIVWLVMEICSHVLRNYAAIEEPWIRGDARRVTAAAKNQTIYQRVMSAKPTISRRPVDQKVLFPVSAGQS
jgi:hypothetical protein